MSSFRKALTAMAGLLVLLLTTPSLFGQELLSIGVEKHQAAFSSGTWLTGIPLTYLAPW